MSVEELSIKMGAAEFFEWVAYYQIQDQETKSKIERQIDAEKSDFDRAEQLRQFFKTLKPSNNGSNI